MKCVWILPVCFSGMAMAGLIHVSPMGDDINPGTEREPVATPKRAQQLARDLIKEGLDEPLEIRFSGGNYALEECLELRPQDSGTKEHPVTWKAAEGEMVLWSGGRSLPAGNWRRKDGGVWTMKLDGTGLAEGQWNFRQLFANDRRITRARFPNTSQANPFLYAVGGGMDHLLIDPGLVKEGWGEEPDAQINLVPNWKFFNQWNTVTGVDGETGRIDFADSERHGKVFKGNWFWVEGVREELDDPWEWYLEAETGELSLLLPENIIANDCHVVAPRLNRLVHAKGDVNAGTHVKHVHFEGIEFRHTTFTLGHIEARVHTDAAVMFENASDCSVRNCHFENIGGYALWLHLDCQRNVFDRNTVRHSGGGGVLMTGSRFSYMDESKVYTQGEAAAKVAPILNEVTRNVVEHCGKIRYYGGGVHLDSRPFSMSMSAGNLIAHNHFNDLSRNGVFAFRNQGGNVVEYNHIHNAMQTTIDGAAIHFATMNHLNAPNYILNNWLYDIWGYNYKSSGNPTRVLANGVFLDWDTSNTTVKDNWIHNTGGEAIKTIWDNWNLDIEGNLVTGKRVEPPFVKEVGPEGQASHGIDLESTRLIGKVVHYAEGESFSTTGQWKPEHARGQGGLFQFFHLVGTAAEESEASFTLPIPEDGIYQVSLLYMPGKDRATNVPVEIRHADGVARLSWDMREGSKHGFAVELGRYAFKAGETATLKISTKGADGKVIADSVAFVKVSD